MWPYKSGPFKTAPLNLWRCASIREKLCAEERRLADEESRSLFENALWLKREREAQDAFRKKREVEEKRKKEKEEREVCKGWVGLSN